jgi:hypothetical protein
MNKDNTKYQEIKKQDFIPTEYDEDVFKKLGFYPYQVSEILETQIKENYWNLYDERQLLEKLLMDRIHFFIIFFTADLLLASNCSRYWQTSAVFFFGACISFILALTTQRIYIKTHILVQMLYSLDENHCLPICGKVLKHKFDNTDHCNQCPFSIFNVIRKGMNTTETNIIHLLLLCSFMLVFLSIITFILFVMEWSKVVL